MPRMPSMIRTEYISRRSQLVAAVVLASLPRLISSSTAPSCYANSNTLQWYINAVGEDPCMTYQRLRQICNSDYTTPTWAIDATTDQCDDSLSMCCCNSIAWNLRMLCINCEWDEFGENDPGHPANAGAYYNYRWSSGTPNSGQYCGDGSNQTLPDSLQKTVCDNGINLSDFLYSIFWPDGSWPFTTFESLAQQSLASNNQTSSYCGNSTKSTTSVSPTRTSSGIGTVPMTADSTSATTVTVTAGATPAKSDAVAVVGGALGGALGLVLLCAIAAVLYIKRRHSPGPRSVSGITEDGSTHTNPLHKPAGAVTPFFARYRDVSPSEQLIYREHTPPGGTASSTSPSEGENYPYRAHALPPSMTQSHEPESEADMYPASLKMNASSRGTSGNGDRWRRSATFTQASPRTQMRERDAGVLLQQSALPPDYRTVYSVSD